MRFRPRSSTIAENAARFYCHDKNAFWKLVDNISDTKPTAGAISGVLTTSAVLLTEGPDYYEALSSSLQVVLDSKERADRKNFKPLRRRLGAFISL